MRARLSNNDYHNMTFGILLNTIVIIRTEDGTCNGSETTLTSFHELKVLFLLCNTMIVSTYSDFFLRNTHKVKTTYPIVPTIEKRQKRFI